MIEQLRIAAPVDGCFELRLGFFLGEVLVQQIFENAIQLNNMQYVATLDGVIGSRGGIPIIEAGKIIGAIGCSGGTGSQDEVACKVGAATVK